MKIARVGLIAILVALSIGAASAALIWLNQARLVGLVLAKVKARTGIAVVPASATLTLSSHLIVTLDHPRLELRGRALGQAARVRLFISYHHLIFDQGLPLFSLSVEKPKLRLPAAPSGPLLTFAPAVPLLPRIDRKLVDAIAGGVAKLSQFVRRIVAVDGEIEDEDGAISIAHLDLVASRKRRLPSPWRVKFSAVGTGYSVGQFQFGGDIAVYSRQEQQGGVLAHGWLGVWNFPVRDRHVWTFALSGLARADLTAALYGDGHVTGKFSLAASKLAIERNKKSIGAASDYAFQTTFDANTDRIGLTNITVRERAQPIVAGECHIDQPYAANPGVALQLSTSELQADALVKALGPDALPGFLPEAAKFLDSARVAIDQASLDARLNDLLTAKPSLLEKSSLDARFSALGFRLPADFQLPPVTDAAGRITYSGGRLTLVQGSARMGQSVLSDVQGRMAFSQDFHTAAYELKASGDLDVGALYPALARVGHEIASDLAGSIRKIEGWTGIEFKASGKIESFKFEVPANYLVTIAPRYLNIQLAASKEGATVNGGRIGLVPGIVRFDDLRLGLGRGEAVVAGGLGYTGREFRPRQLTIRLRRVPAEGWLPLVVPPQQFAVQGLVDGEVVLDEKFSNSMPYGIKGRLSVGPGQFQLGFLRAALLTRSAEAQFTGGGLILRLPSATLEGEPIDFALSVKDLGKPVLRIDATAQKLDLEVMRFVRLPWTVGAPATFFGHTAAEGHVEIRKANLSKLKMTGLRADFARTGTEWRVYNLQANSLGGHVALELGGRAKDNWLHLKGHVTGANAASLFRLSGGSHPPVTDKLYADFDLWADTGKDFFDTSGGKASVVLKDGRLQKFTLLSRVLGLIDLKNWFTAQVPDPRISGVPFRFVTADFAGTNGVFYTQDMVLDGPVLDITAQGSVNVADNSLDMEMGLLPFQTVDWLVNKIPLIGKDISQVSGGILAAYFRVRGPIKNPSVTPEPFTSAAEIVKKTLSLPLNILRPGTVK
jgi:AsmA-like C-terminal region